MIKQFRMKKSQVPDQPEMRGRFMCGYVGCALWASTDDEGESLDYGRDYTDVAPETRQAMRQELAAFLFKARRGLRACGGTAEQHAHDLWLTRNGHGAGFWDRGYPDEIGERLSAAAKACGGRDLYVGDDGKVYQE